MPTPTTTYIEIVGFVEPLSSIRYVAHGSYRSYRVFNENRTVRETFSSDPSEVGALNPVFLDPTKNRLQIAPKTSAIRVELFRKDGSQIGSTGLAVATDDEIFRTHTIDHPGKNGLHYIRFIAGAPFEILGDYVIPSFIPNQYELVTLSELNLNKTHYKILDDEVIIKDEFPVWINDTVFVDDDAFEISYSKPLDDSFDVADSQTFKTVLYENVRILDMFFLQLKLDRGYALFLNDEVGLDELLELQPRKVLEDELLGVIDDGTTYIRLVDLEDTVSLEEHEFTVYGDGERWISDNVTLTDNGKNLNYTTSFDEAITVTDHQAFAFGSDSITITDEVTPESQLAPSDIIDVTDDNISSLTIEAPKDDSFSIGDDFFVTKTVDLDDTFTVTDDDGTVWRTLDLDDSFELIELRSFNINSPYDDSIVISDDPFVGRRALFDDSFAVTDDDGTVWRTLDLDDSFNVTEDDIGQLELSVTYDENVTIGDRAALRFDDTFSFSDSIDDIRKFWGFDENVFVTDDDIAKIDITASYEDEIIVEDRAALRFDDTIDIGETGGNAERYFGTNDSFEVLETVFSIQYVETPMLGPDGLWHDDTDWDEFAVWGVEKLP